MSRSNRRWGILATCGLLLGAGYVGADRVLSALGGSKVWADLSKAFSYRGAGVGPEGLVALREFLSRVGPKHGEFRLTHPAARHHSPYNPLLADRAPVNEPPPELLATLQDARDTRGIGTAYLMSGNRNLALRYLMHSGDGPDANNDLGAAFLALADQARALEILDQALEADPGHPEALWNRGLVLESLDLKLAAADSFEASAERSDEYWSSTARRRADRLREAVEAYRSRWYATDAAGKRMVTEAVPMDVDQVLAAPGIAQLYLYDALRAAQTAVEAKSLLPVAAVLDALTDRGSRLVEQIYRTAKQDFAVRAPLGSRYRELFTQDLDDAGIDRLIADARDARQDDILLGAIYLGYREVQHVDEYVRLAQATKDPWFEALAQTVRAEAASRAQRLDQALVILIDAARDSTHPYRTVATRLRAVDAATILQRIPLAQRIADAAWDEARREGAWSQELKLLQHYGRLATRANELALTRAFFEEARLREPEFKGSIEFIRRHLAISALQDNQLESARAIVERDFGFPFQPYGAEDVLTLIDVNRGRLSKERAQFWLEELDRGEWYDGTPGDARFTEAVKGRLLIEMGRHEQGIELLRNIVLRGGDDPRWDALSVHAHAIATATLVSHFGARDQAEDVLQVAANGTGSAHPDACALAVFIDSGRSTVAWASAAGTAHVFHEPRFRQRMSDVRAADLVPDAARAQLQDCAEVSVFAAPNLVGDPTILPSDTAWRYVVVGRGSANQPSPSPDRAPRPLVIADVALPHQLGLAPLPLYRGTVSRQTTRYLSGRQATVEQVLREMQDATEIEFYTHGTYNLGESHASMLVMAPDWEGNFALTADHVAKSRLKGAPLVLLTACSTTKAPRYRYQSWSLPEAFLDAGAWTVVAAGTPIPSIEGQAFFDQLRRQIRKGVSPAAAVRDARLQWAESSDSAWMKHILVFGR